MRRIWRQILAMIIALFSLGSCAVHEWPDESTPADVVLNLDFNTDIPQFIVINAGDTRSSSFASEYEVRYVVEAYRKVGGGYSDEPYSRYVFTKDQLSNLNTELYLKIDEGTYIFRVWTDFIVKGSDADFYYDTRNFREISLQGDYVGNNDYRDAFVGSKELTVRRYGEDVPAVCGEIAMERPLAKFEFVATDLQEFITKVMSEMKKHGQYPDDFHGGDDTKSPLVDLEKYKVEFWFTGFMPCSFNMMENKPCDSKTGVHFSSDIKTINDHEARLGFDYVMVNGKESSVMVAVGLYDEKGVQLSMTTPIEVPLKRSMLTTIKGNFLMQDTGGGVAINPDFDGEYNIVIR